MLTDSQITNPEVDAAEDIATVVATIGQQASLPDKFKRFYNENQGTAILAAFVLNTVFASQALLSDKPEMGFPWDSIPASIHSAIPAISEAAVTRVELVAFVAAVSLIWGQIAKEAPHQAGSHITQTVKAATESVVAEVAPDLMPGVATNKVNPFGALVGRLQNMLSGGLRPNMSEEQAAMLIAAANTADPEVLEQE